MTRMLKLLKQWELFNSHQVDILEGELTFALPHHERWIINGTNF